MPKKRLLPKNILDQPDSVITEKLFGRQAMRELDKILTQLNSCDVASSR